MKTQVLTAALLIVGISLNAQTTEKKEATIRIQKVENINGVEKITDTTFTTSDPNSFTWNEDGENVTINESVDENGKKTRIVIKNGEKGEGSEDVKIIMGGQEMDEEIAKALKEAGVDPNSKDVKKIVIVNEDHESGNGEKNGTKRTKIVMVKLDITDASDEDKKRLSNQIGKSDDKLEMDNMKLFPNPNDGKFNLNFTLKNKADAEVTVYDMQGKKVYNEKLPNFSGEYKKPIDISSNSKGIYFVKIEQGKHSQVKKIILD